MPAIHYEHHDFGDHYKLFKDLIDGDTIYCIDFKEMSILTHNVSCIKITEISDYYSENRFKVEFEITGNPLKNHEIITIYDGNTFIDEQWDGQEKYFFTTDKRIAKSVIDIICARNGYQWHTFTGLFGNPMSRYADKPVILC